MSNRARGKRPVTLKLTDQADEWTYLNNDNNDPTLEDILPGDDVHATYRPLVIRKKNLKRHSVKDDITKKVKLDRVLGLTVSSNASLDCDPTTGTVVYPSGCVLVLYNQRRNKQTHIINSQKKPITACKFSSDGRYLVTGECGHQPEVRVWDASTGEQLSSQPDHRTGINCVSFSPDGKYVVSVGCQADMMINLWDWRNKHIVASNKVSVKVKAIAFSSDAEYFVTVGNRHVKFWYLSYPDMVGRNSKFESVPLLGKNAILGDQRNNYYCDVACGKGASNKSTYVITKSGLLCEFNERRLLNKWVELKTEFAGCLSVSSEYILVGCSQGIVRCFRPNTLEFVCTLPRPHVLGVDIGKGFTVRNELANSASAQKNGLQKGKYADTVALTFDERNKIVTAIYSDRSIYYWTLGDIKRIGKLNSFFYHSSCIWDLEVYPVSSKTHKPLLPNGTFLTCSSDDTIRIWNPDFESGGHDTIGKNNHYIYKKSYFSPELLKILYMDPELNHLCDPDLVQEDASKNSVKAKEETTYDTKNGIRAIKFSANGKHLASGDRSGNIRIFDLEQQKDLFKIEAHDAEVLCLEYSNEEVCGRALLVSASRDRFIHVYDVNRQYTCIQNIDDHSSSIMAVKFISDLNDPRSLQMISCGADKSLLFRRQKSPETAFYLENQVFERATFYDMAVDSAKNTQIITASQDRVVRVYDSKRAKITNNFKGSLGDQGALIKIALDPSATFIATSCTDKSIYIFDYQTGECLATTSGHAEIVTGLKFSPDGRHLISISGDGCVFAWRLPIEMTNAIAAKLGLPLVSEQTIQSPTGVSRSLTLPLQVNTSESDSLDSIPGGSQHAVPKLPFQAGTLPVWAKNRISEQEAQSLGSSRCGSDEESMSKTLPRGKWANKITEDGLPDFVLQQGLVKQFANNFENMASSRSTPSTPSGTNSPTLRELKMNNRLSAISLSQRERAKSSLSSGVEEDDDDRNTTDSENTYSHESTYRVNKNHSGSVNSLAANRSMISSISIANINDLRYDDDDIASLEKNDKQDREKRLSSHYMSTEHLDRIDQRNRYLKQMFENMGNNTFENNANSASDDSGINQIDHSLTSSATSSAQNPYNNRQSLSSRLNHKTQLSPLVSKSLNQNQYFDGTASDDANTLSDVTDIQAELRPNGIGLKEHTENNGFITYSEMTASSVPSTPTTITAATSFSTVAGLGSSTSGSQPSVSRKREELAKTISDAKKKLETLGWKSNTLKNSKSVVNLRQLIGEDHHTGIGSGLGAGGIHSQRQSLLCDDQTSKHEQQQNFHSLTPFDTSHFRKSISLSDLSISQTLPRKLSVFRQSNNAPANNSATMNNYQFAPLWDSRRNGTVGSVLQQNGAGTPAMGSLSRAPSTNALNKVDMMRNQSTLVRGGVAMNGVPGPGSVWMNGQSQQQQQLQQQPGTPNSGNNVSMIKVLQQGAGTPNSQMMLNPRSGRASAPPSQFRKSATNSSVSCASSRRGDSTEDDEELESAINSDDDNSEEHRTLRARPVTPPKPNILKQMRRGSTSNQASPGGSMGPFVSGIYTQHQNAGIAGAGQGAFQNSTLLQTPRRRLWGGGGGGGGGGGDTMRSSKSEFNLTNIGRDTPIRRQRNNSGSVWQNSPQALASNDRFDLSMANPTSIPLSLDLCQHIINEMTYLTNFASRIYERAAYSNNAPIVEYLSETLGQVSRDIHQITGPQAGPSLTPSKGLLSKTAQTPQQSAAVAAANTMNAASAASSSGAFNPSSGAGIGVAQQEMFQKFLEFMQFNNNSPHRMNGTTVANDDKSQYDN